MLHAKNNFGKLCREHYFPTMIYYRDIEASTENNLNIRSHIYAWKEQDEEGILRSNVKEVGSWHSQLDMNKRAEYSWITNIILQTTQDIFNDLDYDPAYEPAIDNMWANVNPKYGYNRNHTHPNTLWSGVYYVQVPENAGRIYFSDPRAQSQVLTAHFNPETERKSEVWSEVYFDPIPGRLILFPSWLLHEVQPNMSNLAGQEGDRISLSFNLFQKKKYSAALSATRLASIR